VTVSDFIWQALVILACGVGGAMSCRARLTHRPGADFPSLLAKAPHLYLVFPLLLFLPFVNAYIAMHPALQWNMPPWLQFHWAALSWGTISGVLAYVFGFCSVAALARAHFARWVPLCFGVAVILAIQGFAAWTSRPNLPPLDLAISSDGVILQTSAYTCVPASGANIAKILGVHTTEKELSKLFRTTRDGTFPAQALHGMKELGISGRKVAPGAGILAVKPPAMLFVLGDTHAVVYAGMTNGEVELWNPNGGKKYLSIERLSEFWDGHALEFWRSDR
jgi:peptidase C39-like protein